MWGQLLSIGPLLRICEEGCLAVEGLGKGFEDSVLRLLLGKLLFE
jgi:hypothetical protein